MVSDYLSPYQVLSTSFLAVQCSAGKCGICCQSVCPSVWFTLKWFDISLCVLHTMR